MFPAILHTLAFIICLCVQSMGSPLASAWLFFYVAGCAALLYNTVYPYDRSRLRMNTLAWALTIGICCFLTMPVSGAAATGWVLVAMPGLALCLHKKVLPYYLKSFGTAIFIYAIVLIAQLVLHPQFTWYSTGTRYAWPLLDPNSAAAVLNMALIPATWLALTKKSVWCLPAAILLTAMYATGSKAGFTVYSIAATILLVHRFGLSILLVLLSALIMGFTTVFFDRPDLLTEAATCFATRYPIWNVAWHMMWVKPLVGLGIGMFGFYYQHVRAETYTAGWYAHNDILQLAVEMGIPAALVFIALCWSVLRSLSAATLPAVLVFTAILLQAMVEFQLYVPAVSLPLGLALGYCIINRERHTFS